MTRTHSGQNLTAPVLISAEGTDVQPSCRQLSKTPNEGGGESRGGVRVLTLTKSDPSHRHIEGRPCRMDHIEERAPRAGPVVKFPTPRKRRLSLLRDGQPSDRHDPGPHAVPTAIS